MVLLVVDTQKGIVDERLYAFEKFVSNIRELIRTAREQGIEVVYVQHDDGPGTGFSIGDDEFDIYSEFAPLQTEKRFVKTVCNEKFNSQMQQLFAYIFVHFIAPQQSRQHSLFCWQPVITPILLHRL